MVHVFLDIFYRDIAQILHKFCILLDNEKSEYKSHAYLVQNQLKICGKNVQIYEISDVVCTKIVKNQRGPKFPMSCNKFNF
jgi:hypothetical protein